MAVWQGAMKAAELIFSLTEDLPRKEDYGLTSQIRRASLSISSNIAEAFGRQQNKDKMKFYYYARGSLLEVLNHLEYGKRVKYFDHKSILEIEEILDTVHFELNKIIKSLKSKIL